MDKELGGPAHHNHSFFGKQQRTDRTIEETLDSWHTFYLEHFDIELDLNTLRIPPLAPGFDRLLVMAQGVNLRRVIDRCCNARIMSLPFDAAEFVRFRSNNERTTQHFSYALWVGGNSSTLDMSLGGLSVEDVRERGLKGITLPERLLLELKHFVETGRYLNPEFSTICSGTRKPDGSMPILLHYYDNLEFPEIAPYERRLKSVGVVPVHL